MKKKILISVLLFLVTVLVFGQTLVGGRLMVQFSIRERDFLDPRRIIISVENVYTKRRAEIWVQKVAGDIYDIWRFGGAFGVDGRLGTGSLYKGEIFAIASNFFREYAQRDEPVWAEQANVLAKLFVDYITIDHE